MYRYSTGTANYAMQWSEMRSSMNSATMSFFNRPDKALQQLAKDEEKRLAPLRADFQDWLDSLPETVVLR